MLANASRACNASRPLFSPRSVSAGPVSGGTVQVVAAVVALFGVALIPDYEFLCRLCLTGRIATRAPILVFRRLDHRNISMLYVTVVYLSPQYFSLDPLR